ncbi:MAG: tetratricopeptide repeat protein [Anaerolineaceae bacterium]|nr:tetratricopeptide repeat protein [Anaerolineaceae bacterium]
MNRKLVALFLVLVVAIVIGLAIYLLLSLGTAKDPTANIERARELMKEAQEDRAKYTEAIRYLQGAISKGAGGRADVWTMLAECHELQLPPDFGKALAYRRKAIEVEPGNQAAIKDYVDLLIKTGGVSEALNHARKLTELDSSNDEYFRLLAKVEFGIAVRETGLGSKKEHFEASLAAAQRAIELAPRTLENHKLKADILVTGVGIKNIYDRFELAEQVAIGGTQQADEKSKAFLQLAKVYLQHARQAQGAGKNYLEIIAKAEKAYQDALAIEPDNAGALLGLGGIAQNQGNSELAQQLFQRAIDAEPTNDAGYYGMAQLYVRQNKPLEAVNALREAIKAGTPDDELEDPSELRRRKAVLEILANMLIESNDPQMTAEAITIIDRLEKMSAANPAAVLFLRGRIASQKGDLREAERKLLEAVNLSPNNPMYHYRLGQVYNKLGVTGKALEEYTAAVSLSPKRDLIRLERAQLLLRLRKYREAEIETRRVLESNSRSFGAGLILTRALMGQEKYLEAGQMADQLIKGDPSMPQGYLLKAQVMMMASDTPPAEALGVLLSGLDKVKAKARYPLYQSAVRFCRGMKLQSEMADLFTRIDADKDLGEQQKQALNDLNLTVEQLIKKIEKEAAADPENPRLLIRRALLFVRDGKIDEALDVYRKAYDLAIAKDDEDMIRLVWDSVWRLLLSEDDRLQEAVKWIDKLPAGMAMERQMAEALILLDRGVKPPKSELQGKSGSEILEYRSDKIGRAIDKFKDLESRDPAGTDTRPMRALARAYFLQATLPGQENREELLGNSLDYYRKIIALQPMDMQSHMGVINVLLQLRDYAGVASQANEILKFDTENLSALDMKAQARERLGELDEAKSIRRRIRRLRPENVSNLVKLAALEELSRNFKEAEALYREAIRLEPTRPEAPLALALLIFRQNYNNLPQADAVMADLQKAAPDSTSMLIAMSGYYKNTGRLDEALQYAVKAQQTRPEVSGLAVLVSRAHLDLADAAGGDAETRKKHVAQAIEVLEAYLKGYPEALDVKLQLADLLRLNGSRLADSEKLLRVLINEPQAAVRARTILARVLISRAAKARQEGDDRAHTSLLDEAARMAKAALGAAPKFGEARLVLAETEMFRGDPSKAETELKRIDPSDPAYIRGLDFQIQIARRQGRKQAVTLLLAETLRVQPQNIIARMQLADFYKADKDYAKAERVILEGLQYLPDSMPLTLYWGKLLLGQKTEPEVIRAGKVAEKLIARAPQNAGAWAFWAGVQMTRSKKNPALKEEVTAKLEELVEEHKQPWGSKALLFCRLLIGHYNKPQVAMYDKAKALLDQLLAEHKTGREGPLLYYDLSRTLMKMTPGPAGLKRAVGALTDGLKLHPKNIMLLQNLTVLYKDQSKWKKALEVCERILELNDKFVPAIIDKSDCLLYLGRFDEAIQWAKKAVNLDEVQWHPMNNLAWIYATEKNDVEQARIWIDKALRLQPKHPSLLDTSGWIYYLAGDYRAAIGELERALAEAERLNRKLPVTTFHLGMACRLKAEKETDPTRKAKARVRAEKLLREFLKESENTQRLDKDRKEAENVLKEL